MSQRVSYVFLALVFFSGLFSVCPPRGLVEAVVDYQQGRVRRSTVTPTSGSTVRPTTPTSGSRARSFFWERQGGSRRWGDGFRARLGGTNIDWTWDADISGLSAPVPWWQGSNVCVRETESNETRETEDATNGRQIAHHRFVMSYTCDDIDTAYKCVSVRSYNGNTTRTVRVYECCHGYHRSDNEAGCTQQIQLRNLMDALQSLEATELIRAIDSADLRSTITNSNFTIFAPTNEAFRQYEPPMDSNGNNVVVITPELRLMAENMAQVLSAHIVDGFVRSSDLEDDLLLTTRHPQAKIRINLYNIPRKVVTANCVPLVSMNNQATNGVVHTTSRVLMPVVKPLADVISQMPQLSLFFDIVNRVGLVEKLKRAGHVTVFAPSNTAFSKLSESVRSQLFGANACLSNVVLQHLVSHVVCSQSIDSRVWTRNKLGNQLNLTRLQDGGREIVRVNSAELVTTDIMGTNGVLHIIDELLIPDEALNVISVIEKLETKQLLTLLDKTDLTNTFRTMNNFTLFLPTTEALQNLPQNFTADRNTLTQLLKYHVVPEELPSHAMNGDVELPTLDGNKRIRLQVEHSFPFGYHVRRTAQCAPIIEEDIETCGGVIHTIGSVMTPPSGDILDILYGRREFSQLVTFLKNIGFAEQFQSSDLVTFFAPTNQAFSSLSSEVLRQMMDDPEKAKNVIKHHMIQDVKCCTSMYNPHWILSNTERTLDGRYVSLRRRRNQSAVDDVMIKSCDLMATNGIVHAIDQFLPAAIRIHVTSAAGRRGNQNGRWLGGFRSIWEDADDFWDLIDS